MAKAQLRVPDTNRPVWHQCDLCPVLGCVVAHTKYADFSKHWSNVHEPFKSVYKCIMCNYASHRPYDARRHTKSVGQRHMSESRKVLNTFYRAPGSIVQPRIPTREEEGEDRRVVAEERRKEEAEERRRKEIEERRMRDTEERRKKEIEERRMRDTEERRKKEIEERRMRDTEERRKKEIEERRMRDTEERRKKAENEVTELYFERFVELDWEDWEC